MFVCLDTVCSSDTAHDGPPPFTVQAKTDLDRTVAKTRELQSQAKADAERLAGEVQKEAGGIFDRIKRTTEGIFPSSGKQTPVCCSVVLWLLAGVVILLSLADRLACA